MITSQTIQLDVDHLHHLVEAGETVRITPHMGRAMNGKFALALGGLASTVAIVDTVNAARDKLGQTNEISGVRLVSSKQVDRRPAAALRQIGLDSEGIQRLRGVVATLGIDNPGLFLQGDQLDLVGLQHHCVQATAANGVRVETFADRWRGMSEAGDAMMDYLAGAGLLKRWYDADAKKIRTVDSGDQRQQFASEGAYYHNARTAHGVLPILESLFAMEVVLASLEGKDRVYDYLDVNSYSYTQEPLFLQSVSKIAQATLAQLGKTAADVNYVHIASDEAFMAQLGGETNQFEMLQKGERFNAARLLNKAQMDSGNLG